MQNLEKANRTGKKYSGSHPVSPVKHLTVTSIIGDKVVNPEGEDLGKILDLMLDVTEGSIDYVVIEFGGFLSIKQKYFAVPFEALTINTRLHAFVLHETRESLLKYPDFDKNQLPDTNSNHKGSRFINYDGFMGETPGQRNDENKI